MICRLYSRHSQFERTFGNRNRIDSLDLELGGGGRGVFLLTLPTFLPSAISFRVPRAPPLGPREPVELNPNPIELNPRLSTTKFEHNPMDCVQLCAVNKFVFYRSRNSSLQKLVTGFQQQFYKNQEFGNQIFIRSNYFCVSSIFRSIASFVRLTQSVDRVRLKSIGYDWQSQVYYIELFLANFFGKVIPLTLCIMAILLPCLHHKNIFCTYAFLYTTGMLFQCSFKSINSSKFSI